jgi:antitoxin (DNA-binding transcriptional repressor) of toxin-antitoxin stability system
MQNFSVGEFKSKFSDVLSKVLLGESVGITYGKNKKRVAAFVPYNKLKKTYKLKLGLLKGKASFKIHHDFKISEQEFLNS